MDRFMGFEDLHYWVIGALFLYGVFLFNTLVKLRQRVRNAFAQIDVQLKRRHDLIPKLVATVKAYMAHERATLEALTEARGRALAAAGGGTGEVAAVAAAEGRLGAALRGVMALVENYPELKADRNMLQLQEEISSTENRIAFARQAYNDAVMRYNIRRETFPDLFVARLFAFVAAEHWVLEEPSQADPPAVGFH